MMNRLSENSRRISNLLYSKSQEENTNSEEILKMIESEVELIEVENKKIRHHGVTAEFSYETHDHSGTAEMEKLTVPK